MFTVFPFSGPSKFAVVIFPSTKVPLRILRGVEAFNREK